MNHEDKIKIESKIKDILVDAIRQSNIVEEISKLSNTECQSYLDDAKAKLKMCNDAFSKIALMYDVSCDGLLKYLVPDDFKKECDRLVREIEKKVKPGESPKQRILTFSVNDLHGHVKVSTVTKKSMLFVERALSCHSYEMGDDNLFERIFDHAVGEPVSNVGKYILSMGNIEDSDSLTLYGKNGICERLGKNFNLQDTVRKYFQKLVNDNNISLIEFSESLTHIISTSRHDGSIEWITN